MAEGLSKPPTAQITDSEINNYEQQAPNRDVPEVEERHTKTRTYYNRNRRQNKETRPKRTEDKNSESPTEKDLWQKSVKENRESESRATSRPTAKDIHTPKRNSASEANTTRETIKKPGNCTKSSFQADLCSGKNGNRRYKYRCSSRCLGMSEGESKNAEPDNHIERNSNNANRGPRPRSISEIRPRNQKSAKEKIFVQKARDERKKHDRVEDTVIDKSNKKRNKEEDVNTSQTPQNDHVQKSADKTRTHAKNYDYDTSTSAADPNGKSRNLPNVKEKNRCKSDSEIDRTVNESLSCSSVSKQTNKNKISKQEKKSKTTFLYLRLDQTMPDDFDMRSFLKKRFQSLGAMVGFELMDWVSTAKDNQTVITLKFASRHLSGRAEYLIKLGNRDNDLKIYTTFDESEVKESITTGKNEDIFTSQLGKITSQANEALERHDEKIKKAKKQISGLTSTKHMPLNLFYKMQSERLALEDKVKELSLQRIEFQAFLKDLEKTLRKSWETNTFDREINLIRSLFEVECHRLDSALPMYARRREIVKLVKENQVSIILGETGSGKSTQVTQYLYQVGFGNNGIIVCTQPRKVAAISLATRVASEMKTYVGQIVGFRAGMKSKVSVNTKILYMTDHALLNDCLEDRSFSKYSCVIIDEAHERSIYTDLLLGMLKQSLESRPDLKVIVTSATIDPQVFVRYFNNCPVLKVSGRTFPVDVVWESSSGESDMLDRYQHAAVQKAVEIHKRQAEGDILVFMTTPAETEKCRDCFEEQLKNDRSYKCLVLHGQIQPAEQQQIFQPCPPGQRKIVFATNSAETSITIPGVKYVIDTGLVKEKRYDPKRSMDSLNIYLINRSSAEQRRGRAGRTEPGVCYRLYSEDVYRNMDSSSLPELLKVNLGQALLKLGELGIDPEEYDFVQSPDKAAIADATRTLQDIGAMKNGKITETGRWLSKFPLEPRHGLIIAKGKEQGLLYESIVLSAVSSAGSNIFYRGRSETDKKKSDSLKLKFCHYSGDSVTLLNVYKEWDKQPEKKKIDWCLRNAVNSKAIRGVRETVNEICTLMRTEAGLVVERSYDENPENIKKLQLFLFESFSSNICHFLGHERAGYYAAKIDQLVHIHPSSSLNSLGQTPEWIVFEQVLKTSKDFVSGITPVDDAVIAEAVENGTLHYDVAEMKSKQVYPVHTEYVGSRVFWTLVGPAFSKLRILEQRANELVSPATAIIEAVKEKGELTIFTTHDRSEELKELFKPEVVRVQSELKAEAAEHALSDVSDHVKVVIGAGGEVKEVLMPEDYRTVFIEYLDDYPSEETVREKLSEFGVIKACKVFKNWNRNRWGCVTFEKSEDAKTAVICTEDDDSLRAVAGNKSKLQDALMFKAKFTWCRRKSKGFAFVDLEPGAELEQQTIISDSPIFLNGQKVCVREKDGGFGLFLRGLPEDVHEDDISCVLEQCFNRNDIQKINVVREKVETTSAITESFKTRIKAEVDKYAPSGHVYVDIIEPKPQSINYIAFAYFRHPEEGVKACRRLNRNLYLNSRKVTVVQDITTELTVHQNVFKAVKEDLEKSINELSELDDISAIKTKELRNGNFVIAVHASKPEQMAKVRSVLYDVIHGDVLECRSYPNLNQIFTRNGKKFLAGLETKLNCLLVADNRTMTLSIKGNSRNRRKARKSIDDFIKKISEGKRKEIFLKGPDKPCGLMKTLTSKYDLDLEKFRVELELLSVELDYRRHKVVVRGHPEAVKKAESAVEEIASELAKLLSVQIKPAERPTCVTCFLPVEEDQLYRLELCGHPYCRECVKFQLQVALKNKDIPVKCVGEGCETAFVWKDLFNFIHDGTISARDLVAVSVSSFVSRHPKDFRYCITADCPVVYRVTSESSLFQCCECHTRICTSCHVEYHDGITCAMNKNPDEEGERLFEEWKQRNKTKVCPGCDITIQKRKGCNHMFCENCRTHFCWECLEMFDTEQLCYAHLQKNHGSFV